MLSIFFVIAALVIVDQTWRRRDRRDRWVWIGWSAAVFLLIGALVALPGLLYLQKVVAAVLMPLGMVWLLLGASAFVARLRADDGVALILGAAFLALGLVANPWLGRTLLAQLEEPYVEVDPYAEGPFEAIFVMGGGTSLDGFGRPILGGSGDRVMLGARLWHAGSTPLLVPSGSSIAGIGKGRDVARETEIIWDSIDVPDESVEPLAAPRNSSEEIAAYRELVDDRGWERVGLVTSAWHMRRAMKLAEASGLDVTPLPADFRGSRRFDGILAIIPTGPGARDVHRACWEYLGAAVGR